MTTGLSQSVQVRLVRHAHALGVDPNLVLARFATERFLYRLAQSPHADRFVLKGALLMVVWLSDVIRPTRDADLLGFGKVDGESLRQVAEDLCALSVEPDGLEFDATSIQVRAIRAEDEYGGQRVTLVGHMGRARLLVQVDVGIGDDVTPAPEWLEYPSLLDLPRPRLRAYRPETAIAEKVHAMVLLGSKNSRMRDFFDVHALAARRSFRGEVLSAAVRTTFERRRTTIPREAPIGLTRAFAEIDGKRAQWSGYLRRNRLVAAPNDLADVVEGIATFVQPVLAAAGQNEGFVATWRPGGPWEMAA